MPEASACGLYLVLPPERPESFDMLLERVIGESGPACVLLMDDARAERHGDLRVRELTAASGVALLVENDAERAKSIHADGVHLPPVPGLYAQARERLGQRAIIGMGCIETRHDAMALGELGADYIGFGAADGGSEAALERQAELISWWFEIFVVPSVAFDIETPEAAVRIAGLGADFVAVPADLWRHEDAPARIGAIAAALKSARRRA